MTTTSSTGVFDLQDFLPSYLYALRQQLHDAQATFFQDTDLIPFINEARRHVCLDTGCLRTLIVPTFPAGFEKFAFGGVYQLNNPIPVPVNGLAPYQLVSGGGGSATADTTDVPMTVTIDTGAAGNYFQTPIVTFDAPGMNISATAVAQLSDISTTPVTLYGTAVADGTITTANTFATSTGTGSAATLNVEDDATGWGELYSQGNAAAWPALGAAPAPSDHGWIWDVSTLQGTELPATTWEPTFEIERSTNDGTVTAVLYVRIYKRASDGSFINIVTCVSESLTLTSTPQTVDTWTGNTSTAISFDPGDMLYCDVVADITENSSASTPTLYELIGTDTEYETSITSELDVSGTGSAGESALAAVTAINYGEIYSQGTASAWASASSAPSPDGGGWIWDVTTLEGLTVNAQTWTPVITIKRTGSTGSLRCILYVRVYKFDGVTTYTLIVACESSELTITDIDSVVSSWTNNVSADVAFTTGDKLYVDVIAYITHNGLLGSDSFDLVSTNPMQIDFTSINEAQTINWVSTAQINFGFDYIASLALAGLSDINVTSDAGEYNAASQTPAVNIVPVGQGAQVQDDGTGFFELVTQGSGQGNGVVIEDAAGAITLVGTTDVSILNRLIASVDNCTLIWNSQRMALRNMAFSDFSALLRAWVPYTNIPVAFSVYADSIYIGPIPNQPYPYELDCVMYPEYLSDYLTIGQIANRACISAVKYYAAYLAKMSQDETEQAADFLQLYAKETAWACNIYTTRLVRPYNDNAQLD